MINDRKPCSPCRLCLLQEAGEQELFSIIRQRIATIPPAQKASPEEYEKRLSLCKECEELLSGTCRKCGCYVELRAARADGFCPHEHSRW